MSATNYSPSSLSPTSVAKLKQIDMMDVDSALECCFKSGLLKLQQKFIKALRN
jgi:hypothetical protein